MQDLLTPITPERIDPDAAKVVRRLQRFGFQVYLVGGCVRDLLLGRLPKDFDVATSATPQEIKRVFRNCRIIGRRFRLAHIFFGQKIIETSTFRAEPEANGEELLIRRDNIFGTAEQDARRRDFTINGLFYDLHEGRVIDFVGGEADLRARCVRTIGDPRIRFQEDPVRILRAVKFAARLGFGVDPDTERAMIEFRGLIANCSISRVLEEIYRLLGSGSIAEAFRQMQRTGVLAVLFPELAALLEPPQDSAARALVLPVRDNSAAATKASAEAGSDELLDEVNPEELPRDAEPEVLPVDGGPSAAALAEHAAALQLLLQQLLGDGDEVQRTAASWMWRHLEALDSRVVALPEQPPSHALLLAASYIGLAAPALIEDAPPEATTRLLDLVQAVSARLRVSRRDRDWLGQILVTQRRLTHRGRRSRPHALLQRDFFPEAMELLALREHAVGGLAPALERWQALQQDGPAPQRSRRRRGGRRRGRRQPGGAA